MPFFPEWRVPPKFLFAIYVRFGINQTLTILFLFFITFFFFFEEEKELKMFAFFLIRNDKILDQSAHDLIIAKFVWYWKAVLPYY